MKKNEENNNKNLKGISKAVSIVSKIIEVCMIIGAVFCFLATVLIPFLVKKVSVTDDALMFGKIKIGELSKEKIEVSGFDPTIVYDIRDIVTGNKVFEICSYTFVSMVALIALAIFFYYLYKLFKNISQEDTPFTQANVDILTKLMISLIGYIAIPTIFGWIAEIIGNLDINYSWGLEDVILILVIFAARHIFEYGCTLEKKK